MRKIKKGIKLPKPYYAEIPTKDRKTGKPSTAWFPFMLIYELLSHMMLSMAGAFKELVEFPLESGYAKIKEKWCRDHKMPADELVFPIGIHGDGVPIQTRGSIFVISWNICSIKKSERNYYTCISKDDLCPCGCGGRHSLDAIMEVFKWDMLNLYIGQRPKKRHDKKEWLPSDSDRKKETAPLGMRAGLFQSRGDWPWFKWLFGFKGWKSKNHVCWKCKANNTNIPYWDPKPNAKWKKQRINPKEFANLVIENKSWMSPLFSIPGFSTTFICIDALNALDLGFSQ